MKIWLQSGSAGTDPTASRYEDSLRKRIKEVPRPDTEVVLHGPEKPLPVRDRFLASHQLRNMNSIKGAFQAQKEGYDAFASTNHGDSAYYEIREVIQIPVTFTTEVSCHLACTLGTKFGFVTHSKILLPRVEDVARRYGVTERMVPGANLNFTYREFNKMYSDPKPYMDLISKAAKEVVDRGANTLMVCGNPLAQFLYDQDVRELHGALIMDSFAALIKTTELMVDLYKLGIRRGLNGPHGIPSSEELLAIQKAYGVD